MDLTVVVLIVRIELDQILDIHGLNFRPRLPEDPFYDIIEPADLVQYLCLFEKVTFRVRVYQFLELVVLDLQECFKLEDQVSLALFQQIEQVLVKELPLEGVREAGQRVVHRAPGLVDVISELVDFYQAFHVVRVKRVAVTARQSSRRHALRVRANEQNFFLVVIRKVALDF